MQGYSVHDLYTKALALLGLGVLAGAGALVDYWPSSTVPPRPANARVSVRGQVAASAAPAGPSRIDAVRSGATVRTRAIMARADVVTGSNAAVFPILAPVLVPSEALGTSVPLAALATDTLSGSLDQPSVAHVAPAESSEPTYALADNSGAPVARALDEEGDGLITGAFRKTGTSIRKTSVKTGSSIVGAIRGFGGAVRRALPVL